MRAQVQHLGADDLARLVQLRADFGHLVAPDFVARKEGAAALLRVLAVPHQHHLPRGRFKLLAEAFDLVEELIDAPLVAVHLVNPAVFIGNFLAVVGVDAAEQGGI